MKSLKDILTEKEQLFNELCDLVPPERRNWINAAWRPAEAAENTIKAINRLMPHEEELRQIIGENEIYSVIEVLTFDCIKVSSRDKIGIYNYRYFQVENDKLIEFYNGGNCDTAFHEKFVKKQRCF